jgi:uncharacterized membrane protein YraQ (UPF0718 family)
MTNATPVATVMLWLVALVLAGLVVARRDGGHRQALHFALGQLVSLLPRLVPALMTAVFVASLVPADLIGNWLGRESGLGGILLAALLGALVPGGPVIAIPTAVLLASSGAAMPQLVSFITAWSIFAVHRIVIFEIPLVGWRFTLLRLAVGLPLPFLAALLAAPFA